MRNKIWLSSPHMGGQEQAFIKEAFDGNWIAPLGPNVDGFESDLETHLDGACHVAALNSGTAALHLALVLLNVGKGDEVLCQSMTFSASANPILYQGALPVFVGSEVNSWNLSPEFLKIAIKDRISKGKKPKAIIVVHLYGMPAAMDEIIAISKHYEIPIIEDAAEALGSSYKNQKLGTLGDIGIYSFNGNKIITTSAGGALMAKNREIIKQAKFLATQAKDDFPYYQHSVLGFNYKMSNVCAGIGRGQLINIDLRVAQRRANFEYYKSKLNKILEISFQNEPSEDYYSNRWLTTILIEDGSISNQAIIAALQDQNIETRFLWKPMHQQPVFKNCAYYGDGVCDDLFNRGLCLPSGSNLTVEERSLVVKGIEHSFSSISKFSTSDNSAK
ncbi:pyridoxal phosphate-dependent aminotransferase [Mucilaginibacter sp. PAMC 26640]|nr:pyridoxal phosphate-dependent aminotransferase [Mucilaginibacter sp. PAMC 26640]